MADHNHITRDIKPLWGGCPGCDEYHVNALHMKIAEMRDQRDTARAEVAALREGHLAGQMRAIEGFATDLRAKAEGLPFRTWVPPHATDCPGRPGWRGICTCGDSLRASDWVLRADVLALFEEAQS